MAPDPSLTFRCGGCGKWHNGSYLAKFCSRSCQLVYRLRKKLGLSVIEV